MHSLLLLFYLFKNTKAIPSDGISKHLNLMARCFSIKSSVSFTTRTSSQILSIALFWPKTDIVFLYLNVNRALLKYHPESYSPLPSLTITRNRIISTGVFEHKCDDKNQNVRTSVDTRWAWESNPPWISRKR